MHILGLNLKSSISTLFKSQLAADYNNIIIYIASWFLTRWLPADSVGSHLSVVNNQLNTSMVVQLTVEILCGFLQLIVIESIFVL